MGAEGWIRLHRKLVDWEWYRDSKMVHLFLHLLLIANREDGQVRGIPVRRGQCLTGRKALSDETGLSEQEIRTCLDKMTSTKKQPGATSNPTSNPTNEIHVVSTNKYSVITICKYEEYQSRKSAEQPAEKQPKQPAPQPAVQPQTRRKKKEEKNKDKSIVASPPRPTLEEVAAYCLERKNQVDPSLWLDHYTSNGWRVGKNPMRDWKAAVRTWERNGFKSGRKHAARPRPMNQKEKDAREILAGMETQDGQSDIKAIAH